MKTSIKHSYTNQSMKFAGIVLAGALAACGGGSGDGNTATQPDQHEAIPVTNGQTTFTSLGLDNLITSSSNGDMGAAVDSSMRITFSNAGNDVPYHYDFTFNSGLPGGVLSNGTISCGLCTFNDTTADKNINILAPAATQYVQNVFWKNIDNPEIFGFGEAGYLLNPSTITWPGNGTATYTGKAFQYFPNNTSIPNTLSGYALYTSSVTATVDYSAKTIVITVAPDAKLQDLTSNSTMNGVALDQLGFAQTVTDLELSGDVINFDHTGDSIKALGFFGPNAENLAGVITDYNFLTPEIEAGNLPRYISFALNKQ